MYSLVLDLKKQTIGLDNINTVVGATDGLHGLPVKVPCPDLGSFLVHEKLQPVANQILEEFS